MIKKDDPSRKEISERVIETVKEKDIKFIYLQFTDIHGIIKSFEINSKRIEDFMEVGENFDGSSITGYGAIEESDKVAIPDPSTFYILPWRRENKVARIICDIYKPDGERYEGDPRYILQKAVDKAAEYGLKYYCAPEMEFFILNQETKAHEFKPSDMRGYFDYDPYDINERMRYTIAEYCDKMGIEIEALHHEVAFGQHEVDFRYDEAVNTADNTLTIKTIIKTVAAHNDMTATFMPKPFPGINGSGMHCHQSLFKDGTNLFYDEADKDNISYKMKKWIAGQLKYARSMCAVLSSWPNSYKRLVPGYEAPVYVAWGFRNRSPLIRVPDFHGKPNSARCEIRCPDPSGNPYLQFAVLLSTGLEGLISDDIEVIEPTDQNVYHFSTKDLEKAGIISLPGNLREALTEFKKSEMMKEIFGEQMFKNYYYAKLEEYDAYRINVSEWERDRYITRL
ncbi:MAG: type I glutamate--ammonia ligase [Candidatus Lokiarchaeota archaeon]|nr:type I glutamate--ammonia ligase [Candidatus Lokiarchaeota archaeon]MBD3202542.1 type I glutamate--ammonia ligase [Candidatus Lokiarchaeota archaeon]